MLGVFKYVFLSLICITSSIFEVNPQFMTFFLLFVVRLLNIMNLNFVTKNAIIPRRVCFSQFMFVGLLIAANWSLECVTHEIFHDRTKNVK